jgi:hypothetical protein
LHPAIDAALGSGLAHAALLYAAITVLLGMENSSRPHLVVVNGTFDAVRCLTRHRTLATNNLSKLTVLSQYRSVMAKDFSILCAATIARHQDAAHSDLYTAENQK